MKLLKNYFLYALSFCMAAVMMLVPIRAEAAYGTVVPAEISHYFVDRQEYIYLNNTYVRDYEITEDGNHILPDNVSAHYSGQANKSLTLTLNRNKYYSGEYYITLRFSLVDMVNFNDSVFDIDLVPYNHEGLYIDGFVDSVENNAFTYQLRLVFDNYLPVYDTSRIYLVFNLNLVGSVDNALSDGVYNSRLVVFSDTGITSSSVNAYSDIRDIPGYKGDYAEQNQQIIDGILDNTTAVDSAKNGIVSAINSAKDSIITTINNFKAGIDTQFSHLFNNMQAWYNGLTNTINNGIDRLINNYSGTGTTDAANKFDDSAGDLEQVESDLTTITNSSIGSYTESAFDTSVITSLGSSLVYVVTWFTNFWNMGGLFTSILNVGLALSVAFFILRLRGGS